MIKPVSDRRAVFAFDKGQSPVVVIYEDLDYAGSLLESPGRPHPLYSVRSPRGFAGE